MANATQNIDSNPYEEETATEDHYVEVATDEINRIELSHGSSIEIDSCAGVFVTHHQDYKTVTAELKIHIPHDHPGLPQEGPYFRNISKMFSPNRQEDYVEV